jgi:hypothetical protein
VLAEPPPTPDPSPPLRGGRGEERIDAAERNTIICDRFGQTGG